MNVAFTLHKSKANRQLLNVVAATSSARTEYLLCRTSAALSAKIMSGAITLVMSFRDLGGNISGMLAPLFIEMIKKNRITLSTALLSKAKKFQGLL